MANIFIKCLNCGSADLLVRTSQSMSQQTVETWCFCRNCFAQNKINAEVVELRTASFTPQPEALKYNKPFKEVDPNQLEIPMD